MHCGPFLMGDLLKWVLVSIVQFVIGKRFYVAAYRAVRHGSTNMDVLVVLGTTASYVYSVCALLYGAVTRYQPPVYFETSAMIITFVLFGKYLEVLAKGKTSDAIKKLVELVPATALLLLKDKGLFCNYIPWLIYNLPIPPHIFYRSELYEISIHKLMLFFFKFRRKISRGERD
jgi:P-type Cu+ transporter